MRRVTRQEVGRLGQRPADSGVAHLVMSRRRNLVFSLPVGMRKSPHRILEVVQFINVVKGV